MLDLDFIRDVSTADHYRLMRIESAALRATAASIKDGYPVLAQRIMLEAVAITKARATELDDLAQAKLDFFRSLAKPSERTSR